MSDFRFDVSLRVRHPSLEPDEICRQLGMPAEIQWRVGDQRVTPKGRPLSGVYDHSYCVFRLKPGKNINLAEFLGAQNKELLSRKSFLNDLIESGGSVEYFIGWYSRANTGEFFGWKLLKELSDLHIDLAFDVYCE